MRFFMLILRIELFEIEIEIFEVEIVSEIEV